MALPNVGKSLRWMAACAVLVGGFEGLSTTTYHDKLAHGLPTVCYGETEGVKMGAHYTKQECLDMLAKKLPRYWDEIDAHITVPLSDNEKIAYTSFAYNLGSGAFIKSGFLKLLNKGDHVDACNGMLAYTRSMGEVRKGLVIRRQKEDRICLTIDLPGPVEQLVPLKKSSFAERTAVACPNGWVDRMQGDCPGQEALVAGPVVKRAAHKPTIRPPAAPQKALVCTNFLIWRTCK